MCWDLTRSSIYAISYAKKVSTNLVVDSINAYEDYAGNIT